MGGYQVMPRLSADEYAELEQSIVENGVQVPIKVAPDGSIIDGHHRDEIARKHDLHCPRDVAEGSPEKLRGLAFSLNLHRRHLNREQKRNLVAESIKADPQLSDREHGRRTGVSHPTVATVREELESSGDVESFTTREDSSGRSQPASKPRPVEVAPGLTDADLAELDQPTSTSPVDVIECTECVQDFSPEVVTEVAPETLLCPDCLDNYDGVGEVEEPEPETPAPQTKPRRRPLEEGFFEATMRLNKAVTSLENLGKDDRLPKNKNQVARYRNDLIRAIDALQRVADQLI